MAITTILCDVDGTLLDFEASEKAAMQSRKGRSLAPFLCYSKAVPLTITNG